MDLTLGQAPVRQNDSVPEGQVGPRGQVFPQHEVQREALGVHSRHAPPLQQPPGVFGHVSLIFITIKYRIQPRVFLGET